MPSSIRIVGVFLLAAAILVVALWIYRAGEVCVEWSELI